MPKTFKSVEDKEDWEKQAASKLLDLEQEAISKHDFYRLKTPVGFSVATNKDLSPTALRLWIYLCSMFPFGDREQYMPTQSELAARLGVSRRSVLRAAAELEDANLWEFKVERWKGQNLTGHSCHRGDKNFAPGDKNFTPGDKNFTPGDKNFREHNIDRARAQTNKDLDQTNKDIEQITPLAPLNKGGNTQEQSEVTIEAFEEKNNTPVELEEPNTALALTTNQNSEVDKYSERVATKTKSSKLTEQELQYFLETYRTQKPSNFTNHKDLSEKHVKVINKLATQYGTRSLEIFAGALTWVREQDNDWWRRQPFSLNNLTSNDKLTEYADKHFDAMESDTVYRARVEGRALSKDKGRQNGYSIFDEDGTELTGAAAQAAQAVANDSFLQYMLSLEKTW